jgi:hypothetical protein
MDKKYWVYCNGCERAFHSECINPKRGKFYCPQCPSKTMEKNIEQSKDISNINNNNIGNNNRDVTFGKEDEEQSTLDKKEPSNVNNKRKRREEDEDPMFTLLDTKKTKKSKHGKALTNHNNGEEKKYIQLTLYTQEGRVRIFGACPEHKKAKKRCPEDCPGRKAALEKKRRIIL